MLGWGVLGCGDITDKRVAPAINAQEGSRLVSFHSRTAARAEGFEPSRGGEMVRGSDHGTRRNRR